MDDAKFKSLHPQRLRLHRLSQRHQGVSRTIPAPAKPVCATCHADQQTAYDHGVHAKAAAAGNTNVAKCQDCHGSVHEILPASDPKSKVAHANIPQTCGACHGTEIRDGIERYQFRSVQLVPAKCSRQSGGRRLRQGGGLHRLPRSARHPGRHRSEVADQQVQRSGDLRQVPRQRQAGVRAEHPRPGDRARQLAGARCAPTATAFTPSRRRSDPNSSVAAANVRNTCASMPRERAALQRVRNAGRPGLHLPVQLSRHGVEDGLDHGGQLRQLSRRAQHSAVERSALHHQSRQPGEDLRTMPSRRQRQIHQLSRCISTAYAEGRLRQQGDRATSASFTSG